ncbi:MAG TPA: hypothetical protein VMB25_07190 [Bryobacteraceae bacterium]|nr:hypothetical protein [Bryobacteraceae bacterium]
MTPESTVHLLVGTPCYDGRVTMAYAYSLLKLQHACLERAIRLTVLLMSGDALITRARQNLVAHFLENPSATHLLFVDADIGFEPDQVFRLLDSGGSVTAAAYPLKRVDWALFSAAARAGLGHPQSEALSYVVELDVPECIGLGGRFVKVRYAGTGFLMIQRAALEKMMEHYSELRYAHEHRADDPLSGSKWRSAIFNCMTDEAGNYLSEDFSFCRRWTDLGGEIWLDLQSRLNHVGMMTFEGDFATHFERRRKIREAVQNPE